MLRLTPAEVAAGHEKVKALFEKCSAAWPQNKAPEPVPAEPKTNLFATLEKIHAQSHGERHGMDSHRNGKNQDFSEQLSRRQAGAHFD